MQEGLLHSKIHTDLTPVTTYLFATDKHAPRRRRASDFVLLLTASAIFGLVGWAAHSAPPIDNRVAELFSDLPQWFVSVNWIGYSAAGLAAFGLVLVILLRGGVGRGVLRDLLFASLIAIILGALGAHLVASTLPGILPEFFKPANIPTYPTPRAAFIVVVAGVLGTYVTYPVQKLIRWMLAFGIISPFVLQITTLTSMFGAIALGTLSVSAVRVLFGSPEGLPPVGRLSDALDRVGIPTSNLKYRKEQPGTVGLATAVSSNGDALSIKVFGRDASSRMRVERLWNAVWYRSAGISPAPGRFEQAQHEALSLLIADRSGVSVPELVGTGRDEGGDLLLVVQTPDAVPLCELPDKHLTDEQIHNIWQDLLKLHEDALISHGRIAADTVLMGDAGTVFTDFQLSSTMPSQQQLATDVVSLLGLTATLIGTDRALDTAMAVFGTDRLARTLPYVQAAVVAPELRKAVKRTDVSFESLRSGLCERLDLESPELATVQRVSWSQILIAIFFIIAANAIISQIADVGIDTLAGYLGDATLIWLLVTFLIKLTSYSTNYIGLRAVVDRPLPFGPTTLVQSAKSFIGLAVPSMVGRVGMDIRYLQKLGVPTSVAAAQGPLIGFIGFLSEVFLLLVSAWSIGQTIEREAAFDVNAGGLLLIAILVVAIGLAIVFAVPKLRDVVVPFVTEAVASVRSVITSPSKFGQIFFSEMLRRLFSAAALGATVVAFGADLSVGSLIFVSVGTGLLAGIAPVPGGIGVAEATMTALLTATGMDPGLSVTIAVIYRVLTSYMPPVLGFFSMQWLNREGYL